MIYLVLISALVTLADQLTKMSALANLEYGRSIPVIGDFFRLTLVRNSGAAFGFFAHLPDGIRHPFFVVVITLSCVLVVFFYRQHEKGDLVMRSSLAMILGGALGNLLDRLIRSGMVIDFLDFGWGPNRFPVFNFADSCICIAVAMILIGKIFEKEGIAGNIK